MTLRLILLVPMLLFIVSQIISICGAFDALSYLDTDGIDDLSLEDIVFIDPFLHSHVQTEPGFSSAEAAIGTKSTTRVFYVDEILSYGPESWRIERSTQCALNPSSNLWLNNRVLRI